MRLSRGAPFKEFHSPFSSLRGVSFLLDYASRIALTCAYRAMLPKSRMIRVALFALGLKLLPASMNLTG